MKDSIYRFSLDIHSTQSQISIPVPQYDTARCLMATLTEGGKPYQLTDECRAVFVATKADGTKLRNDCIIINGSIIRYDFTEQTTAVAGGVDCFIKIYGDSGKLLTSPRITLVVYAGDEDEPTQSEDEVNVLNGIMNAEVNRIVAENGRVTAEQNRVEAEEARANAEAAREQAEQNREERIENLVNLVYVGYGDMPEDCLIQIIPDDVTITSENT